MGEKREITLGWVDATPAPPSSRLSIEVPAGRMACACGPVADIDVILTPHRSPLSLALVQRNELSGCATPNIVMASFENEEAALQRISFMTSLLRQELGPIEAFLVSSESAPSFLPSCSGNKPGEFLLLDALALCASSIQVGGGQSRLALDLNAGVAIDSFSLATKGLYRRDPFLAASDQKNERDVRAAMGFLFKDALESSLFRAFDLRDGIPKGYMRVPPCAAAPKEAARLEF